MSISCRRCGTRLLLPGSCCQAPAVAAAPGANATRSPRRSALNLLAQRATATAPAWRRDPQTEIAYLRTFSDVCRTHLRASVESLSRSIDEWERTERGAAFTARDSAREAAREPGRDSVSHPAF